MVLELGRGNDGEPQCSLISFFIFISFDVNITLTQYSYVPKATSKNVDV